MSITERTRLAALAAALPMLVAAGCGGGGGAASEEDADASAPEVEATAPMDAAPADENGGGGETETDLMTDAGPMVLFETSMGNLRIELYPDEAPESVENFLRYVEDGHYDGTIFHRVVRGFVIQGGGFTAEMQEKETREPIGNEARNGLRNLRGTLSMARTMDPHSATSQFFVNTVDNAMLDHTSPTPRGWGYAVFGKVVEGLEVVDRIEASPVVARAGHNDVPQTPIVVQSAEVISR